MTSYWFYPVALLISVLLHAIRKSKRNSKPPRWRNVPPATERVLVIGASSGVGREIALRYSRRGAGGIAIVGRRKEELGAVKRECELVGQVVNPTPRNDWIAHRLALAETR
ncbi:uncharacterized protein EI90DRAFT_3096604 [Cantharellus anzutake]|uniref:uncharacterized protein n=1 Tax=Cantharellus anzutake TaxID=1750568 RepID=UPI001904F43E|nr:uncharacterized protein EI90DRAFT_3096604 [Cantharellus anzutake]KAF8311419.1 hypothetical protein EI90DRAFT_3096604 [Cantharellus anzutake]